MRYNLQQMKGHKNNMHTETVRYWDDLCPQSYKVVLPEYKLKLVSSKKIDEHTTELKVSASVTDNLKRFLEDLEEGDLDPLDVISRESDTDDAYIKRIDCEIKKLEK